MRARAATFGDFKCAHCHVIVSSAHLLSGVNNRNHCPYCLWSCHLDLFAAGDRLSACKAPMKPIGLTMKMGRNKYQRDSRGELMLIHQCTECRTLSINRIAADDDSGTLMAVFHESLVLGHQMYSLCQEYGILNLKAEDAKFVSAQLYGHYAEIPHRVGCDRIR
ncbi:MAG TPA: RNHCP domain-containing protein [Anaerolineales bacterium]|nr:RNHCP domain-containing protein [Anaerolineales bacterium]